MNSTLRAQNVRLGVLLLLIVLSILAYNHFILHYPTSSFFSPVFISAILTLWLIKLGLDLQWGKANRWSRACSSLIVVVGLFSLILLAATAAQVTPFPPIDHAIIALENSLGIKLTALLDWTARHPYWQQLFSLIYRSLAFQLVLVPMFLVFNNRFDLLHEYIFLVLVGVLIGFSFYFFFPTTAPASNLDSPWFLPDQRATGIKFHEIHSHIPPSTAQGGLIAMPSFHVIWAWNCTWVLRAWPLLFAPLLAFNALLAASCVMLGWHYVLDVVGSLLVILITHAALNYRNGSSRF